MGCKMSVAQAHLDLGLLPPAETAGESWSRLLVPICVWDLTHRRSRVLFSKATGVCAGGTRPCPEKRRRQMLSCSDFVPLHSWLRMGPKQNPSSEQKPESRTCSQPAVAASVSDRNQTWRPVALLCSCSCPLERACPVPQGYVSLGDIRLSLNLSISGLEGFMLCSEQRVTPNPSSYLGARQALSFRFCGMEIKARL